MSDPSTPDGGGGPPHCSDECLLVRLGFSREDRAALATAASQALARTEVERAIARRALDDRLSAVTALAAGVAHELNNPLAYVTANVGFLAEKASRLEELLSGAPRRPDDQELAVQLGEALRETRAGAERMRTVVRDLATFARLDEDRPRPTDVRPILESCLNIAWPQIRRRAQLVRDLQPVPPVLGDAGRLSQVFLNLLLNAAQAIPEGRPEAHELRVLTGARPDGRVVIEVGDTGDGIAPEHLQRIFDPFFTTREPGCGTGLGLSICHAIVTGMGGTIEVDTAVGKGSRFRVLLVGAPATGTAAAERPAPAAGTRRARVLVVDDEPLVGSVLRRTLAEHDVTIVQTGRAALESIAAGDPFDVVLSDLLMPEMSGMELYRTVSTLHPALARRFVFLTGGAFIPAAREFLEREQVEWLEKPFDLEALRAAVTRRVPAASA